MFSENSYVLLSRKLYFFNKLLLSIAEHLSVFTHGKRITQDLVLLMPIKAKRFIFTQLPNFYDTRFLLTYVKFLRKTF